jgi:hypothetical protein
LRVNITPIGAFLWMTNHPAFTLRPRSDNAK